MLGYYTSLTSRGLCFTDLQLKGGEQSPELSIFIIALFKSLFKNKYVNRESLGQSTCEHWIWLLSPDEQQDKINKMLEYGIIEEMIPYSSLAVC